MLLVQVWVVFTPTLKQKRCNFTSALKHFFNKNTSALKHFLYLCSRKNSIDYV
jgi:hypothetical protein